MTFLIFWGMGIVTALIHMFLSGFPTDASQISTILLLHQFVVTFAVLGVGGVFANMIFAEKNARHIGWPGGPFQIKYGFTQLGLGIMGVMCIWFRGGFWLGTVVSMYMYGIGGLWTHFHEMKVNHKADLNSIANLVMDVAYQVFLTVLTIQIGGLWVVG